MILILIILILFIIIGLVAGGLMFWSLPTPQIKQNNKTIPYLSIIIPARNEAHRLPILLESLQKQTLKDFEIIVIDDHSDDDTIKIAEHYQANVYKNREISGIDSGKTAACANGAKKAQGKWLLFLDADVIFSKKDSLKKLLVSFHNQNAKGILSVQPYHHIEKNYENLSAIFNVIVLTGVNVFTVWKNKFKTAGSFGPCILCDKENYLKLGGHASAEESIMDDFALSDLFLTDDLPVTNYGGKGIINLRMYSGGVKELIEGWTKNLAIASQSKHPFVMLLINLWMFGALISMTLPVFALGIQNLTLLLISLITYVIYGIQTYLHAKKAGNFNLWPFIFYPLLFIFFISVFMYSLYRTHILRSVTWRGRKIKL